MVDSSKIERHHSLIGFGNKLNSFDKYQLKDLKANSAQVKTYSRAELRDLSRSQKDDLHEEGFTINDFKELFEASLNSESPRFRDFVNGLGIIRLPANDNKKVFEFHAFISQELDKQYQGIELDRFLYKLANAYNVKSFVFEDEKKGLIWSNGKTEPRPSRTGGQFLRPTDFRSDFLTNQTLDEYRHRTLYSPPQTSSSKPEESFTVFEAAPDFFNGGDAEILQSHFRDIVLPEMLERGRVRVDRCSPTIEQKTSDVRKLQGVEDIKARIPQNVPPVMAQRTRDLPLLFRSEPEDISDPFNPNNGIALVIPSDQQPSDQDEYETQRQDIEEARRNLALLPIRHATANDADYLEAQLYSSST